MTLLGFLLPMLIAIGVAFVLSLCFVSLQPLWRTHHALLLLSTAILSLLLLLNAADGDGLPDVPSSVAMRVAGRVGAVLLLPLVGLAMVSLRVRVGADGWSPERVLAAAWLLMSGLYALGYAVAALRPGRWLAGIEGVNVAVAAVSVLVLVALLTPLADPARLAAVSFDYAFLESGSAGYGRAALARLRNDPPARDVDLVRQRATAALALRPNPPPPPITAGEINRNVTVHPDGRVLPPTLLAWLARPQSMGVSVPLCLRMRNRRCDAIFLELRHDGTEQLAFAEPGLSIVDLMAASADGACPPSLA